MTRIRVVGVDPERVTFDGVTPLSDEAVVQFEGGELRRVEWTSWTSGANIKLDGRIVFSVGTPELDDDGAWVLPCE